MDSQSPPQLWLLVTRPMSNKNWEQSLNVIPPSLITLYLYSTIGGNVIPISVDLMLLLEDHLYSSGVLHRQSLNYMATVNENVFSLHERNDLKLY